MLRTITIGSCVSIQGVFVKEVSEGRIAVKVDGRVFEGRPVLNQENGPKVRCP